MWPFKKKVDIICIPGASSEQGNLFIKAVKECNPHSPVIVPFDIKIIKIPKIKK